MCLLSRIVSFDNRKQQSSTNLLNNSCSAVCKWYGHCIESLGLCLSAEGLIEHTIQECVALQLRSWSLMSFGHFNLSHVQYCTVWRWWIFLSEKWSVISASNGFLCVWSSATMLWSSKIASLVLYHQVTVSHWNTNKGSWSAELFNATSQDNNLVGWEHSFAIAMKGKGV